MTNKKVENEDVQRAVEALKSAQLSPTPRGQYMVQGPDYKKAFYEMARLVGVASAHRENGNMRRASEYLGQARDYADKIINFPTLRFIPPENYKPDGGVK